MGKLTYYTMTLDERIYIDLYVYSRIYVYIQGVIIFLQP